jgi:hypothetical protein
VAWRFIGAGSAACDVCWRRDLYVFRWGTIYRCVNHLGQKARQQAMRNR